MATSGTTTSRLNPIQLITLALEIIGVLAEDGTLSAAERVRCLRLLNVRLAAYSVEGMRMWKVGREGIDITSGTAAYDLAQAVVDIKPEELVLADGTGADVMLRAISREEYQRIPIKTTVGRPTCALIERNVQNTVSGRVYQGGLKLTLWPVPDGTYTLTASVERRISDVVADSEDIDIPTEYRERLLYDLAYDCAIAHALPMERMNILAGRRAEATKNMRNADNERGGVRFNLDLSRMS